MGWATPSFHYEPGRPSSDGVGDLAESWAIDGARLSLTLTLALALTLTVTLAESWAIDGARLSLTLALALALTLAIALPSRGLLTARSYIWP